jgi:nucleotide-binding universal stress UspA family protein
MFKHVLVPLDFRFRTRATLLTAANLAREHGADVTLLYVENPARDLPGAGFATITSDQIDRFNAFVTSFLNDAASLVSEQGAWARVQSVRGSPVHSMIIRFAAAAKVELIVMGTHGRGGLAHAWWGSVTEDVIRSTDIPVLAIHEPQERPPARKRVKAVRGITV